MSRSDMIGERFDRLSVIGSAESSRPGRWWICKCDCGVSATRSTSHLRDRSHVVRSCGCARAEAVRRASRCANQVTTAWLGPYKQQLKRLYHNMKSRCLNPTNTHFRYYGGRGIRICPEWLGDSAEFYQWATENGFRPGLSIERNDTNADYCPENCRFIPLSEQSRNTRRNVFLTHQGRRLTMAEWARELGVRPQTIQRRVSMGWDEARVLTQPFRRVVR